VNFILKDFAYIMYTSLQTLNSGTKQSKLEPVLVT